MKMFHSINILIIGLFTLFINKQTLFASNHFKTSFVESIRADKTKAKNKWFQRALLTLSCDDCEYIPKVPNAGKVFEEDGVEYQLMHNGIKIHKHCYYGKWMTAVIQGLRGHHEPQEEKLFHEVLKMIPEDATMLELGSYWAYYSLWFAHKIPGAQNYLIEPNATNLNWGKRNFKLNNKVGNFYQGYIGKRKNFGKIQCFEIDSFLQEKKISHLNILHSDIQGAEYEMLQTCKNSIAQQRIDYFFISTHSQILHKNCIEFLKKHNYDIVAEHSRKESFSCDGLIVGKRHDLDGPVNVDISKRSGETS